MSGEKLHAQFDATRVYPVTRQYRLTVCVGFGIDDYALVMEAPKKWSPIIAATAGDRWVSSLDIVDVNTTYSSQSSAFKAMDLAKRIGLRAFVTPIDTIVRTDMQEASW